jgi:hypothetical protein
MDVSLYASKGLVFPGPAGRFQLNGSTSDLVAELGDNYPRYHAFLVAELAKLGRPKREQYPSYQTYIEAYAKAQTIVFAEVFLRNCVSAGTTGTALDRPHDPSVPLVDANDRLVGLPV